MLLHISIHVASHLRLLLILKTNITTTTATTIATATKIKNTMIMAAMPPLDNPPLAPVTPPPDSVVAAEGRRWINMSHSLAQIQVWSMVLWKSCTVLQGKRANFFNFADSWQEVCRFTRNYQIWKNYCQKQWFLRDIAVFSIQHTLYRAVTSQENAYVTYKRMRAQRGKTGPRPFEMKHRASVQNRT